MVEEKIVIKGVVHNTRPSTAHYDKKGRYVHDPLNQPLAEAAEQGLTAAREMGPAKHPTRISGYCSHGQLGGCDKDL
jgi:hypothetical protein